MPAQCDPARSNLEVLVWLKTHEQFENINDFIAFNRNKVKSFEFYHSFVGDPLDSHVIVEFFDMNEALMFKMANG